MTGPIPDSDDASVTLFWDTLREMWSDAARAASAMARSTRKSGGDWRKAGRRAYAAWGGKRKDKPAAARKEPRRGSFAASVPKAFRFSPDVLRQHYITMHGRPPSKRAMSRLK
jgi:hypothetical protein